MEGFGLKGAYERVQQRLAVRRMKPLGSQPVNPLFRAGQGGHGRRHRNNHGHRAPRRHPSAVGRSGQFQSRAEGRGGLSRRPRLQGRVPKNPRPLAQALAEIGRGPVGREPSDEISKKKLDEMLVDDDTEASAVVHSAIEEFAQELAYVTRRFLKTKDWAKTERIVVGGGFRDSRIGELVIARTEIVLKSEDFKIEMVPI